MSGLRVATLDGDTPYDRGYQHGEQFATDIQENVETYLERFDDNGVDEQTAREHATRFLPIIEEANEDYADGMRGIADGSGHSLEEIALLNVRYEILFSAYAEQAAGDATGMAEPDTDGCTCFGVQPEVTADGKTYIGQNWDWIPINTFLMDLRRPDKPNALALTEAGLFGGKFGMNEHGIGYVVNGLVSEKDGENPYARPSHISHLEILGADRLSTAIGTLLDGDETSTCSGNTLVGHHSGEMIDKESTPEETYFLYPDEGILTHANHFESDGDQGSFEISTIHSLCRGPRINRLLRQETGSLDPESLKGVLRDHFNEPASICRHADLRDSAGRTNASVIMDLQERRMLITEGPPCDATYEEFVVAH